MLRIIRREGKGAQTPCRGQAEVYATDFCLGEAEKDAQGCTFFHSGGAYW